MNVIKSRYCKRLSHVAIYNLYDKVEEQEKVIEEQKNVIEKQDKIIKNMNKKMVE